VTASLLALAVTATVAAPPPLFAVVVGNNHPLPGTDYSALRYADDDALRFAEYFESLGARVHLLVGPDEESAARFGALADRAEAPTRGALEATLRELEKELVAVGDREPELFFYFSGHGTLTAADAYLHLLDEPFSRSDLKERVLRRLPAHKKHVIIDSCHSYFLVNARGERVPAALPDENLDRFPDTGFLLSTSAGEEVQEWSGYQAGVFSYQVLGALQGAADVDRDGVVSYGEIHAYLVAANVGVQNAKARIQPFVRRPAVRGHALLDLGRADPGRRLEVPGTLAGHFYLTDSVGRRVLDAHKPEGAPLMLVADRARELFVFVGSNTFAVVSQTHGLALGAPIADGGATVATRGPLADELRKNLFVRPLTAEFVAGVEAMASRPLPRVAVDATRIEITEWHDDPLTLGVLGAGAVASAVGIVGTVLFARASADADARPITAATEQARVRAEDYRAAMIAGYSVAGALVVVGILRAAFTNHAFDDHPTEVAF
jgi:hypothetical protein